MLANQLVRVERIYGLTPASFPEIKKGMVGKVDEFGLNYVNGHYSGGVFFNTLGYYYFDSFQVTPLGKNPELIVKGYN